MSSEFWLLWGGRRQAPPPARPAVVSKSPQLCRQGSRGVRTQTGASPLRLFLGFPSAISSCSGGPNASIPRRVTSPTASCDGLVRALSVLLCADRGGGGVTLTHRAPSGSVSRRLCFSASKWIASAFFPPTFLSVILRKTSPTSALSPESDVTTLFFGVMGARSWLGLRARQARGHLPLTLPLLGFLLPHPTLIPWGSLESSVSLECWGQLHRTVTGDCGNLATACNSRGWSHHRK